MTALAITVALTGDVAALDDDDYVDRLLDTGLLEDQGLLEVVVGGGVRSRPEATFLLDLSPFEGLLLIRDHLDTCGGNLSVHRVQYELLGAGDLARECGVTRQAVDSWSRKSDFPPPVMTLPTPKGGLRAWSREDVRRWLVDNGKAEEGDADIRYLLEADVDDLNAQLAFGLPESPGSTVRVWITPSQRDDFGLVSIPSQTASPVWAGELSAQAAALAPSFILTTLHPGRTDTRVGSVAGAHTVEWQSAAIATGWADVSESPL